MPSRIALLCEDILDPSETFFPNNKLAIEDTHKAIATVLEIDELINKDSETILQCIGRYIQNINIKLLAINKQKEMLETFHTKAIAEYRHLRLLSGKTFLDMRTI
jgi:hypothetical protein